MNKILKAVYLLFFVCSVKVVFAQHCGTDYHSEEFQKNHPELRAEFQRFRKIAEYTRLNKKSDSIRIIPVVFHVIHAYGAENISKKTLEDALAQLNTDFNKRNADTVKIRSEFKPFAADCKIEFRLAKRDPKGECTEGINRIYSPMTAFANEKVKSLIRWDNKKYLNIWVVKEIETGNRVSSSLAGYAQFPGPSGGPDTTDGLVIAASFLGKNKKTLTHEVGHWLGLFHTFQGQNCYSTGDWVDDTPTETNPTLEAHDCITAKNSCDTYDLPYNSDPLDMFENYMGYANYNCQVMFTLGQKLRIDACLSAYRNTIFSKSNLVATGLDSGNSANCKPIADFNYSSQVICQGATVNFFDVSYNGSAYSTRWTFEGSSTSSSTAANPTFIRWNEPGKYRVTLTIENGQGQDSKTKEITVLPKASPDKLPFLSGFENPTLSNEGWIITNEGLYTSWERISSHKRSGNAAIFLHHYSETFERAVYSFYSKPVNFSTALYPTLSFYVAHADRDPLIKDALRVYYSTDCGATWKFKRNYTGVQLSGNVAPRNEDYFPEAGDWKLVELDLGDAKGQDNVQIKFESQGFLGNNIFLDDISIQDGSVGLNNWFAEGKAKISLSPNPVDDEATLQINLTDAAPVYLKISNALGQELNGKVFHLNAGFNAVVLDKDLLMHMDAGVYFITLTIKNVAYKIRLVKK